MFHTAINNTENTNQLDTYFEYATLGILVTDESGNITDINPFALKEFGYSKKELVGKKIEVLIPSRFHNKHSHHHKKYIEDPKTWPMGEGKQIYGIKKNGVEFPLEISLTHFVKNGINNIVAFLVNISVRKEAEQEIEKMNNGLEKTVKQRTTILEETLTELELSKERLERAISFQKAIIDNAGVMIIVTNKEGKIKLYNPEASLNLGYHESEVIDKFTPMMFHDKTEIDRKRKELFSEFGLNIENDFEVMIEKSKRNIHEDQQYNYIRKNGTSFPVSLTITAIRDRNGEIIGYMGVSLDISEQKKAVEELKNVQHLFHQLLRNYPDGAISIIDKDFNFVYTGGELHNRLNAEPKQLIGEKIFQNHSPKMQQVINNKLSNVFKKKEFITDFELPEPIRGSTYVMDAFPLMEEDGSVNKAGSIIRNISALKKTEEDLREALEKEKVLNELKTRFVSIASHEFRTPLSTVLSSAYLIEKYKKLADQPKREKHLQRIVSSVNMLTDILNDLLSVGKMEEGRIQVRLTNINIQQLVIDIISEIKNTLRSKQKINYQHQGGTSVFLDPSLLKHIILNLVSNASKFSPEKSLIEIKTISRKTRLILSVKDHGMGISPEDQKHLMERFFRGANAGHIQGTGLGLHIVSKYAELMNGIVECKSELEKGTEFSITFNIKNG